MCKANILLVGEVDILLLDIQKILEKLNYHVTGIASTKTETVQKVNELHPNLVLMHICLGNEAGWLEAADHIRETLDIAVVYLLDNEDGVTLQRAKITFPCQYLLKSFESRMLSDRVDMALYVHHVEHKLRTNQEKYQKIFQFAPLPMSISDLLTGENLEVNAKFTEICGYSAEEMIGKTTPELRLLSHEDRACLVKSIQETGSAQPIELKLKNKEGQNLVGLYYGEIITVEGTDRLLSTIEDITEKKRQEEAKHQREAELQSLVRAAPIGIGVVINRVIQTVNSKLCEMIGYSYKELIGQSARILYPTQEEFERVGIQKYEQISKSGTGSIETRFQCKNGEIIDVWLSSAPLNNHDLEKGVTFTVLDITDHKKMQNSLIESESRLKIAQQIGKMGNWVFDLSENIFWWSDETYRIFELDVGEGIDFETFFSHIHPDDQRHVQDAQTSLTRQDNPCWSIEYRLVTPSGRVKFVREEIRAFFDASGKVVRRIGTVQDISERKRMELILEARLDLIEFAETHTVKELLQAILDKVEWMTDSLTGFYHFLRDDQNTISLQAWSTKTLELYCKAEGDGLHYPVAVAGVWADVGREERPIIHNDYASLSNRKGLPEGHIEVKRELVVPVKRGNKIVAILGVGNKPSDYLEDDVEMVTQMADLAWHIVEMKLAVDALSASQKRLELFFSQSLDGFFFMMLDEPIQWDDTVDKDLALDYVFENQHITEINSAMIEQYAGTLEQMLGLTPADFFAHDISQGRDKWRLLFDNGHIHLDADQRRLDGSVMWVEGDYICIYDANGHITGHFGVHRDITERKMADQMLQKKTNELETLYEISTHLSLSSSQDEIFPLILMAVKRVLQFDVSTVILLDDDDQCEIVFNGGMLTTGTGIISCSNIHFCSRVVHMGKSYVTKNLSEELDGISEINQFNQLGPAIFVPIQSTTKILGSVGIARYRSKQTEEFLPSDTSFLIAVGEMIGNAICRTQLFDDVYNHLQRNAALNSVSIAINARLDLTIILDILLNQLAAITNVDAVSVLLYDANARQLKFSSGHGFYGNEIEMVHIPLGNGFPGKVALERQAFSNPDLSPGEFQKNRYLTEEFRSYYAIPLISNGQLQGVLELFNRNPFVHKQDEVNIFDVFSTHAAIAIDNSKTFDNLNRANLELTRAYDATIEGWSRALELRDVATEGHTLRVTDLVMKMAQALKVSDKDMINIQRGSLLHDIGKMGIPDQILMKSSQLSEEEWKIMCLHPQYAFDMLWPIEFLRPSIDIPLCHHEKWDGTGYPRGLKGSEIPLSARIFALADVWDALTSDRPYREAWTTDKTIQHIREQAGKHFDPELVPYFLKLITFL